MFFKSIQFFVVFVIALETFHKCCADVPNALNAVPVPFAPPFPVRSPQCNNNMNAPPIKQSAPMLQFRLPFMDMEVRNERNLHILQEISNQQLYVLHGNELYQLFVSGQEKRLVLVGFLSGGVSELDSFAVEVIIWRNQYLLLAIAMEEYVEIYQIQLMMLQQRAELDRAGGARRDSTPMYEPIQQLALNGRYSKMFLVKLEQDNIMFIMAAQSNNLNSKLRTFEWSHTFFELVEELTLPAIHLLNVIGTTPKYLINGRFITHQNKMVITVHEIITPELRLHNRQTLTIPTHMVHSFTFRGRNYLYACTTTTTQQHKCNSFRMSDGLFSIYRQLRGDEFYEKIVAGLHFLVGVRQREVLIYPSARMDCFGSFTTNQAGVSAAMVHENVRGEVYVLLTYHRPFNTLVRIAEVVTQDGAVLGQMAYNETDNEDVNILHKHRHMLEEIVNKLRSLLLKRRSAMDVFRRVVGLMRPKLSKLQLQKPVYVHSGKIGSVRILDKGIKSPLQLLQRVNELRALHLKTRFARALSDSGQLQEMPQHIKVQRLQVNNLIYNGSIIEGFYVDRTAKSQPILSIRAPISAKEINTTQLLTRQNYRQIRQLPTDSERTTSGELRIRDLMVERINNVSVADFFESLFLRDRDNKIKGRLILQAATKVAHLQTPLLNNFVVAQLFNLRQPQLVDSKLFINGISLKDLQAEKVNGLDFIEDIVFSGKDSIIETPVEVQQMSIAGDLLLAYKPKQGRDNARDDQFQQFYTGKVVVNGSLTVTNLEPDDVGRTVLEVNGKPFSATELRANYLLQNTPQAIHTPVIFGNAKVTTPALTTSFLNDHPTEQHLLNTAQTASRSRPLQLIFMNATVQGDLICADYKSKMCALQNDAVRRGEVANITGVKTFEASLSTDHLMTLHLNDLPVDQLVLKSQLQHDFHFYGNKSFDKVVVSDKAYIDKKLNCTSINDLPLNELLQYNYHLSQLQLPYKLEANNIVFHKINGLSFDEIFNKFNVRADQLVLHKDLLIEGNVRFVENLQVDTINDIRWQQYCESLVRLGENAAINGEKEFLYDFTINKELLSPTINNINLQQIFAKVLSKTRPQLITGNYSFDSLRTTNLDVHYINDVPTRTFIDTRAKELIIEGDLVVPKLTVHGSLTGNFIHPFEFETLNAQLQRLVTRHQWRNIVVHGNAYWNSSSVDDKVQDGRLQYLHRNAVRRTGDQVITGNVRLQRPLISKMRTKACFPSDIDLDFIARDCLLKNTSEPQTVHAAKGFVLPLQLHNVEAPGGVSAHNLNQIDVLRLNASLYRLSSGAPIQGPLYFTTPAIVGKLSVQGLVNGVSTAQLFHSSQTLVPPLKLHSLIVENELQLQDINDMSFDFMLANRVTLNGKPLEVFAHLTFENLVLGKQILLQSINDIPIDKLVFTKSDHLQALSGAKVITGELELLGPAHVLQLNGKHLVDTFKQSIFTIGNYRFNNLTANEGIFTRGLILRTPPSLMQQARANIAKQESAGPQDELKDVLNELEQLDHAVNVTAQQKNEHMLYLDFDFHTEVVKHSPNETVDKAFLYDLKHVSMCEHQLLQVQQSQLGKRVFLTNVTTNFITAHEGNLRVKAQNYCQQRYKKVRSKITVKGRTISKAFGMKKFIEHVELYAHNETCIFLLLHAIDGARNRNEVRVLKIDDGAGRISDWQSIRFGVGKTMRLFKIGNHTALLSSALINNQPAVSIYHFAPALLQFKLAQVIDGDFNLMEMVAVQPQEPARYQLILSCRNCQRINFFEYVPAALAEVPYQSFQLLKLQTRIGKLHSFQLQDGNLYLLVLAENNEDFYHLYRYSFVQGWLQSAHGFFQNTKLAVPLSGKILESSGHDLLLLLCGGEDNKCNLVKAFVQQ